MNPKVETAKPKAYLRNLAGRTQISTFKEVYLVLLSTRYFSYHPSSNARFGYGSEMGFIQYLSFTARGHP